jgi:hypothetical protein
MEPVLRNLKTMKTNAKFFLFTCALMLVAWTTRADTIKSSYIGPIGGNWSAPSNWSPAIVPNNNATQKFDVSIGGSGFPVVTLDTDVNLRRLTLTDDGTTLILQDHSLTTANSSVGVNFSHELFGGGIIFSLSVNSPVVADLGDLANFFGNTLKSGLYLAFASDPNITSTIRFNGADIRTNSATVQEGGARGRITDEMGRDALRHLERNAVDADLDFEVGRNFTTEGSFVNEGEIDIFAKDPAFTSAGFDTRLTINGNYTGIGYPLDPNTVGLVNLIAPGPTGNAAMVINGALTNYDPDSQTLHKTYYGWQAANGASAVTRVLGGGKPIDIVTSEASLNLFGPRTGFRDKFGNDALRNLAVSARMIVSNQNFTTANSFTSTSRLSIFGGTRFSVSGHLTIRNGFFEVSPLSGYIREGYAGFPETPYLSSQVIVRGNFNLPSPSTLRFHVLNQEKTATVDVKGAAVLAGSLQTAVEKIDRICSADRFTVLTAGKITGQFSNVASGRRVDVFHEFDDLGNPIGKPIGTFRVTYDENTLVLSDFRPR